MGIVEIILIGVSLAMDALAVSICKGISFKKSSIKNSVIVALWFSVFQALMPLGGYLLGTSFTNLIGKVDHWIAFILLGLIGFNMIKESFSEEDDDNKNDDISFKTMLLLSIATSIDALVVGVTFSFLNVNIIEAISLIGVVTFIICYIGTKVGKYVGEKFDNIANLSGGVVLILLGLKILIEHLFF